MDKFVEEQIEITNNWVNNQIEVIKKYPYEKHRIILYCTIIDSFVQNNNSYKGRDNRKNFVEFLIKYS